MKPTNHLDLPGIEWLEQELAGLRSGIVLISHDRRLLERISRATVWLDQGVTRTLDQGFWWVRGLARHHVLEQEETRAPQAHAQDRDGGGLAALWRHRAAQAQPEAAGRFACVAQATEGAAGGAGQRADTWKPRSELKWVGTAGRGGGARVEVVRRPRGGAGFLHPYSARRPRRYRRRRPNGAGKTCTLLNLLTGALTPDTGEVRLGTNLAQVTLDQRRETLDPAQTLVQALAGGQGDVVTIGGVNRHVIGYMKDFLFGPEQANTPVGVLSGGERGRLTLARAFARPSNLLVLDEPTNDLDLETLDLLQERLAGVSRHRAAGQPRPRLP